ncbi:MAG: ATP-binding protein [Bacteroidaceae bacterium]|nr:ATP-binding protein [Bacteroidaceae bacterium]
MFVKLKTIILKNFRGYAGEYRIPVGNLTALIGKNDAGKSTILDALGIFFEHPLLKGFGFADVCVNRTDDELIIGCEFDDVPESIVIDESAPTNLGQEYLLNENGCLEIMRVHKVEAASMGPAKYFARAVHPTHAVCSNLLGLKIADLKKIVKENSIPPPDCMTVKAQLRCAVREYYADELNLAIVRLPLDKEDAKNIYEKLKQYYPIYALFRADRSSSDEDAEAQDPLKSAVSKAIAEVNEKLEEIKATIQKKALEVANRTLDKLQEFNSDLAMSLTPEFRAEPKWDSLFKLTLKGDNGIPLNKRGSGVRRLVLFSFFRAEAEQIADSENGRSIIYAVEEPETAQHPDFQRMVIETLMSIASQPGKQVLITTHVPGLSSYLPVESLRFIRSLSRFEKVIECCNDEGHDFIMTVANELGVLPNIGAKVALCVEGKHDIDFILAMNKVLLQNGEDIIDLEQSDKVAVIGMGGSALIDWVNREYLRKFGIPEVHIYDSDRSSSSVGKYQKYADKVNARGNGSRAFLTAKREMENYIHGSVISNAIKEKFGDAYSITIDVDDELDLQKYLNEWNNTLPKRLNLNSKEFLNAYCAPRMTADLLKDRNGYDEIKLWFECVTDLALSISADDVRRA